MREMFRSVIMFTKLMNSEIIEKEDETEIDFDCPDCGEEMVGVENNVTHEFEVPKKRCKCQCGYKGFYPVNQEENKDGME